MPAARKEQQNQEFILWAEDWRGSIYYLCLIHCLANDDIKQAYLRGNNTWTRQMLDPRNSESRHAINYEMIADCWKSPTFSC